MNAFAQPCVLTPVASQPGINAFVCRGIWTNKPVEIALEDGGLYSTNQPTLGIRLIEYPVAPRQFDLISTAGQNYEIANVVPDGQGGAELWLKNYDPTDTGELQEQNY